MAPAPAPQYYHRAPPPVACRSRIWSKSNQAHLVPVAAPRAFHHHKSVDSVPSPAPAASSPQQFAPQPQDDSSAPTPHLFPSSPLPAIYFSCARPPSDSVTKPPNGMPSISPSLFSCFEGFSIPDNPHWLLALANSAIGPCSCIGTSSYKYESWKSFCFIHTHNQGYGALFHGSVVGFVSWGGLVQWRDGYDINHGGVGAGGAYLAPGHPPSRLERVRFYCRPV
ncbi:hypothetical protein IHE45_13G053500 [Dioscorea alata]|uniref:Uncharacterized protein n=1 Tax=Dioscorea alata TaxID=55571 RepID=A0ACB7UY49_DIOAL|nr:hypothetical protein IHE45_13G053500 [Dioscorea alata]